MAVSCGYVKLFHSFSHDVTYHRTEWVSVVYHLPTHFLSDSNDIVAYNTPMSLLESKQTNLRNRAVLVVQRILLTADKVLVFRLFLIADAKQLSCVCVCVLCYYGKSTLQQLELDI